MTKRHVSLPDGAEAGVRGFIDEVDERLSSEEDTCEVVRDTLIDLHGDRERWEAWQDGESVSKAERVRLQGYDPCNATLESEYYAEKDEEKFQRSKHLQWLWRQFDATPMADNVDFALRFRQMLGNHLFAECGEGCRFFKGISVTYGHNIEVGDSVVGARSVVQGDVPDHHVVVGSPARSVRVKPGWESVADESEDGRLPDRQDEREIEYELPEGLDQFDEFQRDLRPPDVENPSPPPSADR